MQGAMDPLAVSAYGAEQPLPLTGTGRGYKKISILINISL